MTARFSHKFLYVALTVGAFLATSLVFRALVPPSSPEGVAEKSEFFARYTPFIYFQF